jgi:hypothetical protein
MRFAGAYKSKGEHIQNITRLEATLQKCKEDDNLIFLRELYCYLAVGNFALGNYRQTYQPYKNYNRYEDTLTNEAHRKAIANSKIITTAAHPTVYFFKCSRYLSSCFIRQLNIPEPAK